MMSSSNRLERERERGGGEREREREQERKRESERRILEEEFEGEWRRTLPRKAWTNWNNRGWLLMQIIA